MRCCYSDSSLAQGTGNYEHDLSVGIMVNKRRATQLDIREQQVSSECEVVIVCLKYQLRGTSRVFCPAAEVWTKSA